MALGVLYSKYSVDKSSGQHECGFMGTVAFSNLPFSYKTMN